MKAGRELAELVAEKVMGFTLCEHGPEWASALVPRMLRIDLPRYPEDIGAAMEVVEKLTESGWYFEFSLMGGHGTVSATASFTATPLIQRAERIAAVAQTLPEAICLAALKAVGAEVPA